MGTEALYLLIPVSVFLAMVALGLFLWAMLTGQFDDLETPALRILFEEDSPSTGGPLSSMEKSRRPAQAAEDDPAPAELPPLRRHET